MLRSYSVYEVNLECLVELLHICRLTTWLASPSKVPFVTSGLWCASQSSDCTPHTSAHNGNCTEFLLNYAFDAPQLFWNGNISRTVILEREVFFPAPKIPSKPKLSEAPQHRHCLLCMSIILVFMYFFSIFTATRPLLTSFIFMVLPRAIHLACIVFLHYYQ